MRRLPDSELELMLIIWNTKEAVSRAYIEEKVNETKTLASTTILSLLSRLENKGFVKVEKQGKSNYYSPLICEEDYAKNESKTILERFHGNSLKNFVANLYDTKSIDTDELEELKAFIDKAIEEES